MNYDDFIDQKLKIVSPSGFTPDTLNPHLMDFQHHIVLTALQKGRYAIFADCGMGKTIMQLSWADAVAIHTQKPVLILAPLAVIEQTIREASKFGIVARRWDDKSDQDSPIVIANYEQLSNIDTGLFSGVVLDESSILKSFEGKYRNLIIDTFKSTPYKLACTATPSPNDPMELGNHSEFLGHMTHKEMLAMFFVHDGGETSKWRLKRPARKPFFNYVGSWAMVVSSPADIGFHETANRFVLPDLVYETHEIETPVTKDGLLFNTGAVSATDFNEMLRSTMNERMSKAAEIANSLGDDQCIVWVNQNAESSMITKMIDGAIEVSGSDSAEFKSEAFSAFARGDVRVLVTKKKIAQFGLNFQNCHHQIFASLDFSFEGLYQAVRRSYRFGQKEAVHIHMLSVDAMSNVLDSIKRKEDQFKEMQREIVAMTNEKLEQKFYNVQDLKTDEFLAMHGDCVQRIQEIESNSIDFSVFSPPFAELYTYSDDPRDMGNSKDYDQFLTQFQFLVRELARVIKPGRNIAVHCMDLPIQKGKEGFIGLRDFSGMIIDAFANEGFIYHSRVTIWKNPVVEMQRTKALGLLHKQVKKDSTMSRVGIPDYVLIFRNAGDNIEPVTNTELDVDTWQQYASPVWMDIDYSDTLNARMGRGEEDEKHICPLQLQTIMRLVHLYTNKGETVLSPFMGIGSEGYQSLKMGRKFVGIELKASYYSAACSNLKSISNVEQKSLFEMLV